MTKILTPEEYNERSLEYAKRTCEALEKTAKATEKSNELYERDLKLDEAEAAKQDEEESDEEDTPAQKAIDDLRRFWQAKDTGKTYTIGNRTTNLDTMRTTCELMLQVYFINEAYTDDTFENIIKVLNTKVGRER